jgi:hypothetical protein
MNCEEYWNDVTGAEPEVDFDTHLAGCPACAARCATGGPVAANLRLLAADMKRVTAPQRVEARLLRAYRERYGQRVAPARELHRWWAAAAAVLLAAGGLWTGARPPERPRVASNFPVAIAGVDEQDAAFIPLPNAAGSPQDDDVDLVRVELPRSAVTALGIPGNDDGDSASVEAEVLVGSDGMARAVRFLN